MNSYSNRLMALGAAIMVVLGLAGTFNALTLLQYPQHPAGAVVERSLYAFEASPYVKEDLVVFDMDLAYNFTDAFQWNTKVLFVFVKAVYQTEGAAFNEVVVWDDIVTAKDAAELETTRFLVDYPLRDKHMQAQCERRQRHCRPLRCTIERRGRTRVKRWWLGRSPHCFR